ncbi:MAG: YebC/PmpR family DNA-binding transcriptional regulator [Candidatus Harrisonbacteria bacterium]|nr:YebC/PmpR family DNA-binding transcriptional regulator [Candidatus Harrisonbacteria bacterium]
MAGHSHWKQIKQQKGRADAARGALFSKLLAAISIAAKTEPNPDFNPRLRSAIEKAKENKVPLENIERAIKKASEEKDLAEFTIEAYGPEGIAIIIEGITDNTNRTTSEIRHLLDSNEAKMANPGSVLWGFEKAEGGWKAKFPQAITSEGKQKLEDLVKILEDHNDVQKVITNAQ